jgi:hypothetical protein
MAMSDTPGTMPTMKAWMRPSDKCIPATESVYPPSPMEVDDAPTWELASHIIIPKVSDKDKAAALPITIDLIKDMTIDNSVKAGTAIYYCIQDIHQHHH